MFAKFEPDGPAALVADPVVSNMPEFKLPPKEAAPFANVAYPPAGQVTVKPETTTPLPCNKACICASDGLIDVVICP